MISIMSAVLICLGLVFFAGTTVGMLRFPDFYTRVHAAGKGDTLSSLFIASGLALYNLNHFSFSSVLVSVKILLICVFVFISSPTTSHALMEAGYESGEPYWTNPEHKHEQEQERL